MPIINLKNKTKKNNNQADLQIGLSLLLALGIIALIFIFLIIPMVNESRVLKKELQNNQLLLTELKAKAVQLDEAQLNYEKIGSQSALLEEAMSNYSDVPEVTAIVEKLVTDILNEGGPLILEGIEIDPMSNDDPQAIVSAKNEEENTLRISFIGDYQAVRDFILKLKALRHNFTVNQIAITAPQDQKLNQFLTVSIDLTYYYFE